MSQDGIEQRLERLERRVRELEDQIAIYQIVAGYGPSADSRQGAAIAAVWAQDGRYDYGGRPHVGADDVATLVDNPTHLGYVERGCAHVLSMPLVHLDGDRATATGYSRVYLRDGDSWKVERAGANRWELVRTDAGWRVANRVNRLLDGNEQGRDLLARGVTERG